MELQIPTTLAKTGIIVFVCKEKKTPGIMSSIFP